MSRATQIDSAAPIDAREALVDSLRRFRRRTVAVLSGAALAWGVALAMALLIAGTWADLVFELSAGLRIGVLIFSAVAGLILLGRLAVRATLAGRARRIARRLDQVTGSGGEILAGTELMLDGRPRSALSGGLAHLAIDRAATLASRQATNRVMSAWPLIVALSAAAMFAAVIGAAWLVAPRMVRTEYLRLSDPHGDHPPYSAVVFRVEPGNADVVYGAGREIKVVTQGPPLDRLDLVLLADGSGREEVLPMFGEPGGVWRATVTSVQSPLQYFARCRQGRSHRFQLGVITLPRLEAVRFRITPPGYTHKGAYEGGLPQGGLAGLPGTRVQVWARSNRPLSAGTLKVFASNPHAAENTQTMQPTASGEHEVSGSFEIRGPGKLEIRVRDVDGQESQDVFAASFAVLDDQRPFVRLLDPPAVSLSTSAVVLPVALAAEDDYGISRLSLYRSLNDSRALPVDLSLATETPETRSNHATALPLPEYGLRPGDEIKLFARVEDNDPAGAKGSESPLAVVRIISQQEYEKLVLARRGLEVLLSKYDQARRRMEEMSSKLEELAKELSSEDPDSEVAADLRKQMEDLSAEMREHAEEIHKSADSELPFDIDESMTEHLRALAQRLNQAAENLETLARARPVPPVNKAGEELEAIRESLRENAQEYEERTTEPLERLARVYALMEDQARFTELYKQQRDLAERLDSLRDQDHGDDPRTRARMRDLEAEQYRIRAELRDLLQDIEDHARQLPDDPELDELRETATNFASAVKDSGAAEAMADAEAGLAEFSGTRGAEKAREAEQILARFLGNCQAMGEGGKACLKFAPNLGENLGNTVQQLLDASGLGQGQGGRGQGGYSMQSNSLDNVGLFGSLPSLGAGNMSGDSNQSRSALFGRAGQEGSFEDAPVGRVDPLEALRAAGAGEQTVPHEYRQRVRDYLETIADELGRDQESNGRAGRR